MSHGTKKTLPPSGLPEEVSSQERGEAYRRRMNRTTMPLRVQRLSSVVSTFGVTCEFAAIRCCFNKNIMELTTYIANIRTLANKQVLAVHAIFFADFGDREHVFSPVRSYILRGLFALPTCFYCRSMQNFVAVPCFHRLYPTENITSN